MSSHARLSPSGAVLWSNCPESLKHIQVGKFNHAMAQGTLAHTLAQDLLDPPCGDDVQKWPLTEAAPWYLVRADGFVDHTEAPADYVPDDASMNEYLIRYDDEMQEHVKDYVEYVREVGAGAEKIHVELSVDISALTGEDGAKGMLDAGFYNRNSNTIHIIDLKYGYNEVRAAENPQLIMYAWAFFDAVFRQMDEAPDFILHVYQPRIKNIDTVGYSLDELTERAFSITKAAKRTHTHPDDIQAGDHCYKGYCPAMATCPAAREVVYKAVTEDLPEVNLETLSGRLKAVPFIGKWCGKVEADADTQAIEKGVKIPGFKVVEGNRGARTWIDEDTVDDLLAKAKLRVADRRTMRVISPPQVEKLYKKGVIPASKWEDLQECITSKDSKYKVVPESDKRRPVDITPAIDLLPEDNFDDLI